tara:strand:- start:1502 stop:4588 length:3087 start_codon:yes stop_codon:yes gene_type:complete
MDFKKLNIIGGWIAFAIALFTYGSTVEPTASFWDCGEYIATSYRLEVGHPPGAPTFMMIGRLFSMLASDATNVAFMINMLSALSSALTILFLFWIITYLARKFVPGEEITGGNMIAVLGSAMVGSLAFTFSDTFWFSAVEGEVYAMSSFCTALVFWAILKWESVADEPHSNRWLIFIAYVVGLSIGVHLLNLLAIPAIVFVYYFKKYEPTKKGIAIAFTLSIFLLGFVQMVLIPQVVNIAAKFEMLFVNGMGMPFHTGSFIFAFLMIAIITFGIWYSHKNKMVLLNTSLISFVVLMIGYTSFGMILVRSNANPPIDENNPENMVNLLAYLNREQYGDIPLATGQFWASPLDNQEPYLDGTPVYFPNEETGRYEVADEKKNSIPNYAPEFKMFFPRMWSNKGNHVRAYKAWSSFKGKPMQYRTLTSGQVETIYKPTFAENMRYFMNYQVWWMWGRYFMWNFAGRQNDMQGHGIDQGSLTDGNWMSGIPFIDSRIGNLDKYPTELENHKAYNKFFLLPLILGLVGIFFQYKYDNRNLLVVGLLFVMTGLAIAVYLNMYPYQPRERDYAFVGSFFTFTIWIGLAVMGAYKHFRDKVNPTSLAAGATALGMLVAPVLMAKEGWDDHDRSDRYTAREIAKNYLDSCAPNAILFTNGDNDTFPLWYVQEVEGYRTDVRVVNLMLLNTDWYIESMARKAYDSEGIPISMKPDQYRAGTRDFLRFVDMPGIDKNSYYDISKIVEYITSEKTKQTLQNGERENVIPTNKFKIPVDKQKVIANGIVAPEFEDRIVDEVTWKADGRYILKSELAVWDILAHFNWERPIYFAITMGSDAFFGLEDYFIQEGFAYRFTPAKTAGMSPRNIGGADVDKMYDRLMSFEWGGYENTDLWMDENNLRFVTNIRFTFSRLAEELINRGEKEKALQALDRVTEVACNSNTPLNGAVLPIIEGYYKIGEFEKGNAITKQLAEREKEYIEFYASQEPSTYGTYRSQIDQSFGIFQQLMMYTTQQYPDCGISEEMNQMYQEVGQTFGLTR